MTQKIIFICDYHHDIHSKPTINSMLQAIFRAGFRHVFTEGSCALDENAPIARPLTEMYENIDRGIKGVSLQSQQRFNSIYRNIDKKQNDNDVEFLNIFFESGRVLTDYAVISAVRTLGFNCTKESLAKDKDPHLRSKKMLQQIAATGEDIVAIMGTGHCQDIMGLSTYNDAFDMHYFFPYSKELEGWRYFHNLLYPNHDESDFCEAKKCAGKVQGILSHDDSL